MIPMKLTAIVAMTPERVIGRDGTLPWHLPEDLRFFKRTTSGHPVVMGRATYDSIGRPLPNRRNLVLTRDPSWSADGVETIPSPAALDSLDLRGEVFIIGGAAVYEAFLPRLDELLVSQLFAHHPGDTRFPEYEHLFAAPETVARFDDFEVRRYRAIPTT